MANVIFVSKIKKNLFSLLKGYIVKKKITIDFFSGVEIINFQKETFFDILNDSSIEPRISDNFQNISSGELSRILFHTPLSNTTFLPSPKKLFPFLF